jgi:spermidine synthase
MGMTSPFLIRIMAENGHVGDSAGRVFGISTIGSVVGTFLPILVFIPTVGTGKTIVFFAAVLFIVTALGFAGRKMALLSMVAVVPLVFPIPSARETAGKIYSTESAYQYIEVFDKGSFRYLVYNDAAGFQTVANKKSVLTGLNYYYDYYSLIPFLFTAPPQKALIVGLGGGIIANQLHYFHPNMEIEGVEIDPKVIQIARTYFALSNAVRTYNQDGRIFVGHGRNKYDILIIDAYTQQVYIPFHLTTVEFFNQVKQRLSDDGIVAMNVSAAKEDAPLIQSISNTLRIVFAHVYRLRIPGSADNVVIASDRNIDFRLFARASGTELEGIAQYSAANVRESLYDNRYKPLTDDLAPIEHMVDWEILRRGIKG